MLYTEYLKTIHSCPFCACNDRVLVDTRTAFLTYAKAQYHEHHMLVIPKRHVIRLSELTDSEREEIDSLIARAVNALERLNMKNISVLVRDGAVGNGANKSIDHLHYHIVPEVRIGTIDSKGEDRRVMSDEEIEREVGVLSRVV